MTSIMMFVMTFIMTSIMMLFMTYLGAARRGSGAAHCAGFYEPSRNSFGKPFGTPFGKLFGKPFGKPLGSI